MAKRLDTNSVREILKDSSYELIGEFKGTKEYHTFRSTGCNHKFSMLWKNLQRKISKGEALCKDCSVESRVSDTRLTFMDVKREVLKLTQKEYKVVSNQLEYVNNRTPIKVLHKTCGHTFDITFSNFQQGRRCPYCANKSKESKTAQLLKRLLEHLDFDYVEEKTFDDLKNPFTEMKLRYDIYIESLNTVIEVDGEQHHIPVKRFGGERELVKTKYRDYLKNKFCMENKIKLIRVSLYDVELGKKKTYDEMKLEVFYLLNNLVDERKKRIL